MWYNEIKGDGYYGFGLQYYKETNTKKYFN